MRSLPTVAYLDRVRAGEGATINVNLVADCARAQMTDAEIAARLGFDLRDFMMAKKKDKRIADAIRYGKTLGRALLKERTGEIIAQNGSSAAKLIIHMRENLFGESQRRDVQMKSTETITHRHTIDLSKCTDDELAILRVIAARQEAAANTPLLADRSGDRETSH